MRSFRIHSGVISLVLLALSANANAVTEKPGQHVDNFRLLDHQGASHELYYLSDMKAVVLMVQENGCKPANEAMAELNQVRDRYRDRGVEVLMINSSLKDNRDSVRQETAKVGSTIPVLLDSMQLIGESLEARRAGEALVIDPKSWTLKYRGPVNRVGEVLDAQLSGAAINKPQQRVKSCKVSMPERHRDRAHAKISYEKAIAPMLADRCVTCHRQGGIGPWAMNNYTTVRGFSPMIREVLRTERMPPWHADPHYGTFSNNRALTDDQVKTLVHWIEAGSPRGKGSDPLASNTKKYPDWAMGEPDMVVEIPPFAVPATGTIAYQTPIVKNTLGRDVWLRAIDFAPTNRAVVHHILGGLTNIKNPGPLGGLETITAMGVYVPGDVPHGLPQDTGVFIPKGSDFVFQMHYTANGKAVSEVTRVGLYFAKEAPKFPLRNTVLINTKLKIPPNVKSHTELASRTFERDTLIYTLMAHSHFRGIAASFVANYPDGSKETLLSVPRYDFNWQTSYELAQPKLLPKGTRLVYTAVYDNSTLNKANPDPNIEVHWGEQTWEEMVYGDVRYRFVDDIADSPKPVQVSATP